MNACLLRQHEPFPFGYTSITTIGEPVCDTGMGFGILRLRVGERFARDPRLETALLLMHGGIVASAGGHSGRFVRESLLEQGPTVLHVPRGARVEVEALVDCELALCETHNDRDFSPTLFGAEDLLDSEQRGRGMLDDAAYRIVRTVFDTRNRPQANLVLGEVVTLPGRWSSFPPHHHPQPEIYHYRFHTPAGYGFSELGEEAVRRKAALKVVELVHERIANKRYEFAHQVSRALVNRFGLIAFEDLNIKNMLQNHCLAKSISDVAWNMLVTVTSYKAANAGSIVVLVDPINTSKMCSRCGILVEKTLADRVHNCSECGLSMDRDWNAAINILRLGLQSLPING